MKAPKPHMNISFTPEDIAWLREQAEINHRHVSGQIAAMIDHARTQQGVAEAEASR